MSYQQGISNPGYNQLGYSPGPQQYGDLQLLRQQFLRQQEQERQLQEKQERQNRELLEKQLIESSKQLEDKSKPKQSQNYTSSLTFTKKIEQLSNTVKSKKLNIDFLWSFCFAHYHYRGGMNMKYLEDKFYQ